MLKDEINGLIMAAMKAKDRERTMTLQLIKAEIQKVETAKGAKPYDEGQEVSILKKMVKQREDSIAQYSAANREDLAQEDTKQMAIIKEFLPAEISEETILAEIDSVIALGVPATKQTMGIIIKSVKSSFPTADGKLISQLVMKKIS